MSTLDTDNYNPRQQAYDLKRQQKDEKPLTCKTDTIFNWVIGMTKTKTKAKRELLNRNARQAQGHTMIEGIIDKTTKDLFFKNKYGGERRLLTEVQEKGSFG